MIHGLTEFGRYQLMVFRREVEPRTLKNRLTSEQATILPPHEPRSGTGVLPVRIQTHRRDARATTAAPADEGTPVQGFNARNSRSANSHPDPPLGEGAASACRDFSSHRLASSGSGDSQNQTAILPPPAGEGRGGRICESPATSVSTDNVEERLLCYILFCFFVCPGDGCATPRSAPRERSDLTGPNSAPRSFWS